MKSSIDDWGKSLGIGIFVEMFVESIAMAFRFITRHPFTSMAGLLGWAIYCWIYAGLGMDVVDVRAMSRMDEAQIAQTLNTTECSHEDTALYCEYDYGRTKIWYGPSGHPVRMEMEPEISKTYVLNQNFYRYALYRIGVEYHEPITADADEIVWRDMPGIRQATITTNEFMTPTKWEIDFQ